ncbi:MAG: FtsX-like permease family protein, partial [Candidatus Methanomethylophilaceae archaeon]
MRAITSSVLRKNQRMKGRVIGISLLMALATGMFIMGFYDADSLEYSVEKQVETSKFPDYFITFSSMEDRSSLETLMDGHLANGSLQAYDLRIVVEGFYMGDDSRYPAIFVGISDPARDDINRFQLSTGTYFSSLGQAMVQKGMEAQGLDVGSNAEFRILGNNLSLQITGTGTSTEHIGTGTLSMGGLSIPGGVAVVFLPLEQLEPLMGPGVNSLIILSTDSQTVLASLDGYNVSQVLAQEDTAALVMLRMGVDELRNVMPVMSLLFLAVGVVATTMIFSRVVENDGRLIGVLMAMGYRNGEVVKAYMSFGLLIAAISSILGVVFGYVISIYMLDIYKVFLADIDMYPADTILPFVLAVAVNFIAILMAMTLPLLRLRRYTVKEALEHRKNDRLHISRISVPWSRMSLMGLRNTFRNPRQTFTTLLVVGLAVGVAGSWVVLGGSALNYLSDQMDNEAWDMEVNFAVPQDVSNLSEAGLGLPAGSTNMVIPFMTMLGTVHHSGFSADSLLVGSSDLASVKSFNVLQG